MLRNHVAVSKMLHSPFFYFLKPTTAERYKCVLPFARHKHFPRLQFSKQKETTNQGFPPPDRSPSFLVIAELIAGYILFDIFIALPHARLQSGPGGPTDRRYKPFKLRVNFGLTGLKLGGGSIMVRNIFNYLCGHRWTLFHCWTTFTTL